MPQAASAFLFCLSVVLADEYGVLYFNCFAVCQVSADNCNLVSNLETAVGNKVVAVVASCTIAGIQTIEINLVCTVRDIDIAVMVVGYLCDCTGYHIVGVAVRKTHEVGNRDGGCRIQLCNVAAYQFYCAFICVVCTYNGYDVAL